MKVAEKPTKRKLTPQQRTFVQAVVEHAGSKTIPQCGELAGYSTQYSYDLYEKPHIFAAVQEMLDGVDDLLKREVVGCKKSLARRGQDDSRNDCNEACRILLQAEGKIGTGGATQVVRVSQHAEGREAETLEDRMQSTGRIKSDRLVSKN